MRNIFLKTIYLQITKKILKRHSVRNDCDFFVAVYCADKGEGEVQNVTVE